MPCHAVPDLTFFPYVPKYVSTQPPKCNIRVLCALLFASIFIFSRPELPVVEAASLLWALSTALPVAALTVCTEAEVAHAGVEEGERIAGRVAAVALGATVSAV